MRISIKKLEAELAKRMKAVAIERDRLDALIGDATELKEDCENALDLMDRARDALSELV